MVNRRKAIKTALASLAGVAAGVADNGHRIRLER